MTVLPRYILLSVISQNGTVVLAVVKIKGYGFGYYAASFYVVEW